MKYKSMIALAGLLLGGCATLPLPTTSDLSGEWRFAYAKKALVMFGQDFTPPPSFDTIEFKDQGTIRLVDSMMRHEFTGAYTLVGNQLSWTFSPRGVSKPIEHRLECSWTENGQALVLRLIGDAGASTTETEWVFYKSSRFLSAGRIVGKWIATGEGKTGEMSFEKDGRFHLNGKMVWGYYRLWPSRYGHALTTPIWIEGEGGFIVMYLYKVDSDRLTLTPLTWNGPEKNGIVVLTRSKTIDTPNQVPENIGTNAPNSQH